MNTSIKRLFLLLTTTFAIAAHAAPQTEEEDLALAYGDKSFVSIASGSRQPVTRAPSVATVVTAEDIAAIGAADLDEVLETVPGMHVARSPIGYNPI
jgi:outer membrane receptor for ferrienterochelin and colicin